MTHKNILVVDDEAKMQRILEIVLRQMGHSVTCAGDGQEALTILEQAHFDLVVTDMKMPRLDGVGLLRALRGQGSDIPVIMITAFATVETAVEAMKEGASDYIIRPFKNEVVVNAVQRALKMSQIQSQNRFLKNELDSEWNEFVGESRPMQGVYQAIRQVAPTNASVFIYGETGAGKELAARGIHKASGRSGLFVPVNCAAIPEEMLESQLFGYKKGAFTGAHKDHVGKFELADEGTLFLDEITEMPLNLQSKLLRVLQENQVEKLGSNQPVNIDVRIIAASNRDPLQAVEEKILREDLYYRLNVFSLVLPPLRDREADIALLAHHFLEQKAARLGRPVPRLSAPAIARLSAYHWPGNVRELENVIERALILCTGDTVEPDSLLTGGSAPSQPEEETDSGASLALQPQVEQLERQLIVEALAQADNNKSVAARKLEVSERTLWYKIKKYGLGRESG